jgi:hypothetical protein
MNSSIFFENQNSTILSKEEEYMQIIKQGWQILNKINETSSDGDAVMDAVDAVDHSASLREKNYQCLYNILSWRTLSKSYVGRQRIGTRMEEI